MAHTKAGGSTKLGRDSASQRLGVKRFGSETVRPGDIIVRQRGMLFRAGEGTKAGKDDSIFATTSGSVVFSSRKVKLFTGKIRTRRFISVSNEEPKTIAVPETV
jgi:large subunit ribosomal protein L27